MTPTMQSGSKSPVKELVIELVNDTADFRDFDCGIDEMDIFIHNGLDKSVASNFCKLYKVTNDGALVALFALSFDSLYLEPDDKEELRSFETLSVDSSYQDTFWSKHHYPALEIAYIAVRKDLRGMKIGSSLINAIALKASEQKFAGCQFLTVEALTKVPSNTDYSAVNFYSRNHFQLCEYPDPTKDTVRMFRPLFFNPAFLE